MAKKQKKRSASMVAEAVVNETAAAPRVAGVSRFSTEFNPDYAYVKQDLKRIGILAGSFFVILVVLSFFLR
jgi:hypothetical protein